MVITLNMIVRDEEHTLPVCLRSVRDWVDEIIVVDTGSIDGTVDIATAYGATVAHFAWCDDFSAARNFALAQVKTPWVFWLDADDMVLNPELTPRAGAGCPQATV
jgi:glycosyltransferase involved in cell wall biosynthesis